MARIYSALEVFSSDTGKLTHVLVSENLSAQFCKFTTPHVLQT